MKGTCDSEERRVVRVNDGHMISHTLRGAKLAAERARRQEKERRHDDETQNPTDAPGNVDAFQAGTPVS